MNYLRTILETAALLALPPLLMSVILKTKAWFGGRKGPAWSQTYYDLAKLLRKDSVYSQTTTWIFRVLAPWLIWPPC